MSGISRSWFRLCNFLAVVSYGPCLLARALMVDTMALVLFLLCAPCSDGLRNGIACHFLLIIVVVLLWEFGKYPPSCIVGGYSDVSVVLAISRVPWER